MTSRLSGMGRASSVKYPSRRIFRSCLDVALRAPGWAPPLTYSTALRDRRTVSRIQARITSVSEIGQLRSEDEGHHADDQHDDDPRPARSAAARPAEGRARSPVAALVVRRAPARRPHPADSPERVLLSAPPARRSPRAAERSSGSTPRRPVSRALGCGLRTAAAGPAGARTTWWARARRELLSSPRRRRSRALRCGTGSSGSSAAISL